MTNNMHRYRYVSFEIFTLLGFFTFTMLAPRGILVVEKGWEIPPKVVENPPTW